MTDHILDALKIRLEEVQGKRKARVGRPGFDANIAAIDEAIAQLEAEIAKREAEASAGAEG